MLLLTTWKCFILFGFFSSLRIQNKQMFKVKNILYQQCKINRQTVHFKIRIRLIYFDRKNCSLISRKWKTAFVEMFGEISRHYLCAILNIRLRHRYLLVTNYLFVQLGFNLSNWNTWVQNSTDLFKETHELIYPKGAKLIKRLIKSKWKSEAGTGN